MSWDDQIVGYYYPSYQDELYHHGIKGMQWGVRRYRNEDGSLTSAGKQRYSDGSSSGKLGMFQKTPKKLSISDTDSGITKRTKNDYAKMNNSEFKRKYSTSKRAYAKRVMKSESGDPYADTRAKVQASDSKLRKKVFEKSKDAESKQMTSVHLAEKSEKYDRGQSTGKRLAKRILLGSEGTSAYNMARAAGVSRGKSAVALALAGSRVTKNAADMHYQRSTEGRRYTSNTRRLYDN